MIERHFKQVEGAGDVGFDEHGRSSDRAIDMALRRQVHHCIDALLSQQPRNQRAVGNIALDEAIVR